MRRTVQILAGILASLFAFALFGARFVLDEIGRVLVLLDLGKLYDSLVLGIAAHPWVTDIAPGLLLAAGLGSLALTHVWPHLISDLLRRKRVKCVFDPKIRGCLRPTIAALRWDKLFPVEKEASTFLPVSTARVATGKFTRPDECYLARIQIQPKGDYEVESCSAALISIRTADGRRIYDDGPITLTIMPAERPEPETKRLFPGSPEYIDVFRLTDSSRIRIMTEHMPSSFDLDKAFATNGDYVFKVRINGRDCPTEIVKIGLHWEQNWRTATVWGFRDRIIGRPIACAPSPMPPTLGEETARITLR